jgi:hypothetical protein
MPTLIQRDNEIGIGKVVSWEYIRKMVRYHDLEIKPEFVARMTVCPFFLIRPSDEKTTSRIALSVSRSRPVSTSSSMRTGSLE